MITGNSKNILKKSSYTLIVGGIAFIAFYLFYAIYFGTLLIRDDYSELISTSSSFLHIFAFIFILLFGLLNFVFHRMLAISYVESLGVNHHQGDSEYSKLLRPMKVRLIISKGFSFIVYFPLATLLFVLYIQTGATLLFTLYLILIVFPVATMGEAIFGSVGNFKRNYCYECHHSGHQMLELDRINVEDKLIGIKTSPTYQNFVMDETGKVLDMVEGDGREAPITKINVYEKVETKYYKCTNCGNEQSKTTLGSKYRVFATLLRNKFFQ
jgi:hypothetical protein